MLSTHHNYRNKIVFLSYLMAVLIVIRHASGIDGYNMPAGLYWFEAFMEHFTDMIVPMFFAVSGYLFYYNLTKDNLTRKLTSRLRTIVIPFVLWGIIGYIYYKVMTSIFGGHMNMEMPPFSFLGFLKDVFIDTKYNSPWFLQYLIVFIYITPLFSVLLKNKWLGGGIFIIVLMALGYALESRLLQYSVAYVFGAYVGLHNQEIIKKQYSHKAIIISLSLLIVTTILELFLIKIQGGRVMPLRLAQIPLIWIAADALALDKEPLWWMKLSFFIYVCHDLILESVEKVFWIIFGNTTMGAILDYTLAPVITLLTITLLAFLLKKIPIAWGLLNGNRG